MADRELNAADASAELSRVFAKKLRVSEKVEQAHIVQLLRSIGGKVYVSGTVRRRGDFAGTMQTPGIPDVEAFLPAPPDDPHGAWVVLKVECKARGGRLRPEQAEYRRLCEAAQIWHVVGGLDAVIAWLASAGYVRTDQFPHYRQPRTTP